MNCCEIASKKILYRDERNFECVRNLIGKEVLLVNAKQGVIHAWAGCKGRKSGERRIFGGESSENE